MLEANGWHIATAANGGTAVYVATADLGSVYRRDAAGAYTAVASLLSENFPTEQRAEFSLPAGKAVSVR